MTRKRHTEEQIIAVLKDAQAGVRDQDLCRKHGISDATLYKWRTKFAGLEVSDVKKLRQGEFGNRASLNQRAIGSPPTRPTKINNLQIYSSADLHSVDAV
jgi:putative transposase